MTVAPSPVEGYLAAMVGVCVAGDFTGICKVDPVTAVGEYHTPKSVDMGYHAVVITGAG